MTRQLAASEADVTILTQRLEEASSAKGMLESKVATLEVKLSNANMELASLKLVKDAVTTAEHKLAAVSAREEVAERSEEKEMGQKRLYRHSAAAVKSKDDGASTGDDSMFDYDVAFQFDTRDPSAGGTVHATRVPSACAWY